MISVEEAKEFIRLNSKPLPAMKQPLMDASGKILAEDIYAPLDIPAFPQSSMDGYALFFDDANSNLQITGEVPAGRADSFLLTAGNAVRIFTGAPVPDGADTVVMQEKCRIVEGQLIIEDEKLKKGDNVRPAGSEIVAGALAMEKGALLTPAAMGFLAGIGLTHACVYPAPLVGIIVTGNELQTPGLPLAYGQVYESNSLSLQAALNQAGISQSNVYRVEDNPARLTHILQLALDASDMVLLTGGISVGDYDFTLQAAKQCGVSTIFHKIKQRPGKPLYFGTRGNKLVFGLPGNPSSVLTCFYEYVLEAISIQLNKTSRPGRQFAAIEQPYYKNSGITHFLKGIVTGDTVCVLDGQESYKLNSFAKANCLIIIPENTTICAPGDQVEIHRLPQ